MRERPPSCGTRTDVGSLAEVGTAWRWHGQACATLLRRHGGLLRARRLECRGVRGAPADQAGPALRRTRERQEPTCRRAHGVPWSELGAHGPGRWWPGHVQI